MALTEEQKKAQLQLLLSQAMLDPAFRAELLAQPREAARKLGIELAEDYVSKIRAQAAEIVKRGKAFDDSNVTTTAGYLVELDPF